MGKSLTRKIIEPHIVEGAWQPGAEIGIRIDQTLTQDATGTMAYLQFEAMGIDGVRTELSVSYIDHNTVQIGFENADDHAYLESIAARHGIVLSRAGNGICHQVHLERFGRPGKTLLGSDSHTPTGGGIGMMAIGAGGLDVALAMAGAPFYLACPRVVKIHLAGKLKPWVAAKDVILHVLKTFGTKGNVGTVFEYGGPGVRSLSVPDRATIANMGAECGVTTSVFPSDAATHRFLEALGRAQDWTGLEADADAEYDGSVEINLSELVPLAAAPHSPGNITRVQDIAGLAVDQVCIGSCTNSSFTDLAVVAGMLKGRVAAPGVSLVVAPGSKLVLQNIAKRGLLGGLLAAGARIAESACGFCIGNSQSPRSKGVSLRTSNRNFEGRSGTKDARVYLVSPETAAAAAITGRITDPRSLGMRYPAVRMPRRFLVDDGMFIFPKDTREPSKVRVLRGPNIGAPPACEVFPADIKGVVSIKVGDKITTDHIMPAGARMKYRSNIPKYAEFVFEAVDAAFAARAAGIRDSGRHNIIVGGESYGEGSSREHAAICPMFLGVKVIIAKSFQRIHTDNLANFGILPLVFKDESDYDRLDRDDELSIDGVAAAIRGGNPILVVNATKGARFEAVCNLTGRQKEILLAGGALALQKQRKG